MTGANILIVGAGPVGLTAALELARRDFSVRIIDKGKGFTPVEQSRALGVNARTMQLLAPSGVSEYLDTAGNSLDGFEVFNEKNRPVISLDFLENETKERPMRVVPQGTTERLLGMALSDHKIEIEWNREVIDTNGDQARPAVDINTGDGVETIRCDFLIGADGASSNIRKGFGFTFGGDAYPTEFGLVDLEFNKPVENNKASLHFKNDRMYARFPISDHIVRFVSPRPDISEILPADFDIKHVVWQSTFHTSFRHVEKLQRGNVLLIGDAAHVHSPVGGRGMNLGIEDACWLAWAIDEQRMDEFTEFRMPAIEMVLAQTRRQTDGLVKMNAGIRFIRDHVAGHLLKFGPIKKSVLARISGMDTVDPPWLKN